MKGIKQTDKARKGTNGLSTNGVTANFMFFDRGTFWVPIFQNISKSVNVAYFFSNLSKLFTFAAAPLLLLLLLPVVFLLLGIFPLLLLLPELLLYR